MTSYVILCHMENTDKFPSVSPSKRKCSKNPRIGKVWEISNRTFSQVWMLFFHQIHILWYYFVIPKIHGICHQFPIACENAAQTILLEKNRTLTLILLPRYGSFCSIESPSYGIQHFMVRTWVFSRVFRSMGKFSKTSPSYEKNLEHLYTYFTQNKGYFSSV